QEAKLNPAARKETVTAVSRLLLDNYVFLETAAEMSKLILGKLKAGGYNTITDPVALSDALTVDLYSVYHDRHLLVRYFPPVANPAAASQPSDPADPMARLYRANFGLQRTEVLPGNIGYINITNFWADDEQGRETLKAALQFVSHTNALIIDLRGCGGGSQETVRLICSYFLEKPTHINSMYDRPDDTTTDFITTPDPSFTKMTAMPLYILTSGKTFSAAEEFCYDLQNLERATIVGEVTGGGAHGTFEQDAGHGFVVSIPYSRAINPVTKTSWEGVGVIPEVRVPSDKAPETAEMIILDSQIAKTSDSGALFTLNWDRELLRALNNPMTLDTATLQNYAGVYGERAFTLEGGKLYYQRTGRPKFELEAMSPTMMKGKDNNYFKIEFVADENGKIGMVKTYYQDNRVEISQRTK
ncbi:MAG TPA: S41 family peptidase, partial [Chryseolinea sp.]